VTATPGADAPVATRAGPAATTGPPQASWHGGPQRWTLRLVGDWRAARATDADANADTEVNTDTGLPQPLASAVRLSSPLAAGALVVFDGQALTGWDSALAARLWTLTETLRPLGAQLQLDRLPAGLREVLALAAPPASGTTGGQSDPQADRQTNALVDNGAASAVDTPVGTPAVAATGPPIAATSLPAARTARRGGALAEAAVTAAFLGDVLIAVRRWLRGRSALRAADVLQQLDLAGPRSLPIVGLTCGLIGLMLAYMAGAQLGRIGAQNFLADVVTVGMVRELAGLMTGIILAGRVGSAFAAQLATMAAGEEIDALRVLGIDPISHLVLPRLLALALVAPALIGFGALAGVLAGWPAAVGAYGVTSAEYFHQCLRALNGSHLGIGLFKGLLYAALAGLAGCREGLQAGRSAQAVGAATTAAVVKALVWIVAAACGTTVLFTNLGY
jgi:phospholipid/cholesterol/gamma-HCH transport system permease protein